MEAASPKECFRALRKLRLISEKDTELLLLMADDRNEIIHTYQEKFSGYLYKKISKSYYILIDKIYNIIKKNYSEIRS